MTKGLSFKEAELIRKSTWDKYEKEILELRKLYPEFTEEDYKGSGYHICENEEEN